MPPRGLRVFDRKLPVFVAAGAVLLTLLWAGAAVAMSGRGLDLTDEGFYLLSYRWWDSTPRTVSGVQYIYGPVFELLGYSVRGLRLFRLLTVLAAHTIFAWAFIGWLHAYRPQSVPSRGWRVAAASAIVASGGVTYGWLPMSPGYNDVAALGSLTLLGAMLRTLRGARLTGSLPVLPAIAVGPLAVALVLAKWASAGVALLFLLSATIAAVLAVGANRRLRFAIAVTASTLVSLLACNFLVGGFGRFLPPVLEVNRLVGASTNSPAQLLRMYLTSGLELVGMSMMLVLAAVLIAAAGALIARRNTRLGRLLILASPVAALVIAEPSNLGLPGGGAIRIPTYTACLVAMAALAGIATVTSWRAYRPRRARDLLHQRLDGVVVVVVLGLLPLVQALGTGNPVYYLAVSQFACWAALMVAAVAWLAHAPAARLLAMSAGVCAVIVAGDVGASGLLAHPYRTSSFGAASVRIGGSSPLASLKVSAVEAHRFTSLQEAVGHLTEVGRPMMAFDELPGVILMLNGRSVGEAWYSATDPARTAAGIRETCDSGNPWGNNQPIVIFDRSPDEVDRRALADCDIDLSSGYRRRAVYGFSPTLVVYLPNDETSKR